MGVRTRDERKGSREGNEQRKDLLLDALAPQAKYLSDLKPRLVREALRTLLEPVATSTQSQYPPVHPVHSSYPPVRPAGEEREERGRRGDGGRREVGENDAREMVEEGDERTEGKKRSGRE